VIASIGQAGSSILATCLPIAVFLISLYLGERAADRVARHAQPWVKWACFAVFAATIFMLGAIATGSATAALKRDACKGSADFDYCMDPPPPD
jgi:hypothetical protein